MKKGKQVVLGSAVSLAVGALAGILFAPHKGSKTRRQIADKTNEFLNAVRSQFIGIRDSISRKLGIAKKDAKNLAGKGKAKFNYAKNEVKNASSEFKHSEV